jgi:hypothetical protein
MAATGISGRQIRDGTIEDVDLAQQVLDTLNAPLRVGAGSVDLGESLNFEGGEGVNVTFNDATNTVTINMAALTNSMGAAVFEQTVPVTTWIIDHALGKYPSVTLVDVSGFLVYCDIEYVSESRIKVATTNGFVGRAFLNSAGALGTFTHNQLSPALVWNVTHTLGKYPSVTVVDSANNIVYGDVQYLNNAQITITMSAPFSGAVFLN